MPLEWKSDTLKRAFSLEEGGAKLAFVEIKETKAPTNKFRVKSGVSFMYYGERRQNRLERSKKQWVVTTRKFADRETADRYAQTKQRELEAFVRKREAELNA